MTKTYIPFILSLTKIERISVFRGDWTKGFTVIRISKIKLVCHLKKIDSKH